MGKFKTFKKLFGSKKANVTLDSSSSKKAEELDIKRKASETDSDYASEKAASVSRELSSIPDETSQTSPPHSPAQTPLKTSPSLSGAGSRIQQSEDVNSIDTSDSGIRDKSELVENESVTSEPRHSLTHETDTLRMSDSQALSGKQISNDSHSPSDRQIPSGSQSPSDKQIPSGSQSPALSHGSESEKRAAPSFSISAARDISSAPPPTVAAPVIPKPVESESKEKPWILRRQTEYGQLPQETRCYTCSNSVYPQEKIGPIKKVIYHHWCLQCAVCYCQLSMKNFTTSNRDLRDRQVYCRTHQPK